MTTRIVLAATLGSMLVTTGVAAKPILYTVSGSPTAGVTSNTLSTVNVSSGEVSTIGTLNAKVLDIAFDDSGTLYGTTRFDPNASGGLYEIDPSNADTTFIGDRTAQSADINTNTLTDYNGKLYTSGSLGSVFSLNKATADPTFVTSLFSTEGPLGNPAASPADAFGVNGESFYVGSGQGDLFKANLGSGAADYIGELGFTATGLSSSDSDAFYGTSYAGGIYQLDPTRDTTTDRGSLLFDSGLNQITGASFGPDDGSTINPDTGTNNGSIDVPAPSAFLLFVAGVLAIFARQRFSRKIC